MINLFFLILALQIYTQILDQVLEQAMNLFLLALGATALQTSKSPLLKRGLLSCEQTYGPGSQQCGPPGSGYCYKPFEGQVRPFISPQSYHLGPLFVTHPASFSANPDTLYTGSEDED